MDRAYNRNNNKFRFETALKRVRVFYALCECRNKIIILMCVCVCECANPIRRVPRAINTRAEFMRTCVPPQVSCPSRALNRQAFTQTRARHSRVYNVLGGLCVHIAKI